MPLPSQNIKVLILETEPGLETLIRSSLEPTVIEVQSEKSVDDCAAKVITFAPDIVIIDLNDNGENNHKACISLRSITRIPLLVVSPFDSPKIVATTLNAGADDYLVKPIQLMELKARIESLLKRSQVKSIQSVTN